MRILSLVRARHDHEAGVDAKKEKTRRSRLDPRG